MAAPAPETGCSNGPAFVMMRVSDLMRTDLRRAGLLLLLLTLAPSAWASDEGEEEDFDPIHHISDGYYLDFLPIGKVELPRLFVVRRADGSLGLDTFASTTSALASGQYHIAPEATEAPEAAAAHAPADTLAAHSAEALPVSPTTPEAEHAAAEHAEGPLVPTTGTLVIDLSITRHLVFAWLGMLLVAGIFLNLAGRYKRGIGRETAPRGLFQNLFESLVEFVRDDIARPNLGDKTDKYLPYLLTVFFFILFSNFLGLVPFAATATSNIAVTAVLAVLTFVFTQLGGTKDYWKHIFWPPGVPAFVKPILIPVELMGIFTKPFALAIRLFANMTAGHMVILSLIGLIFAFTKLFGTGAGIGVSPVSVAFAVFIYLLELLVCFIQAFVFTMLSSLFIGMAVAEHEHHAAHDEHAHAPQAVLLEGATPGNGLGTPVDARQTPVAAH